MQQSSSWTQERLTFILNTGTYREMSVVRLVTHANTEESTL